MKRLIVIAAIVIAAAFAPKVISAFQPGSITLTNPADYGNLIVALEEAQAGASTNVAVGTSNGVVNFVIPAKQ